MLTWNSMAIPRLNKLLHSEHAYMARNPGDAKFGDVVTHIYLVRRHQIAQYIFDWIINSCIYLNPYSLYDIILKK